jgi:hypothetical protein
MAIEIQSAVRMQLLSVDEPQLLWLRNGDSSETERKENVRRWKPLPED